MTPAPHSPETRALGAEAPARRRLMGSAIELIRTHGMAGTTVSGLLAHSGAARRTLYQQFGSREALLTDAVREAGATMTAAIGASWSTDRDPDEALDLLAQTIGAGVAARGPAAGCPIMAAALGSADVPDARPIAAEVFAEWRRLIAAALEARGAAAERAGRLATTCIAAIEGAIALGIAEGTAGPVEAVALELRELLHAALPASPIRTATPGDPPLP